MTRPNLLIAQLSDLHCGSPHFDARLLTDAVNEVVGMRPDLVVIGGDLTADGYANEFRMARGFLEPVMESFPTVVIPRRRATRRCASTCSSPEACSR